MVPSIRLSMAGVHFSEAKVRQNTGLNAGTMRDRDYSHFDSEGDPARDTRWPKQSVSCDERR